jgi:antitoxin component YwqK of YwqJK toxin-antitoxin module
MRFKILFVLFLLSFQTLAQDEKPKPKMVRTYWDFNSTIMQSEGYYYADEFYGETTLKHGRWKYWDKNGNLEEEQIFVKGKPHGPATTYHSNGKKKSSRLF